MTKVKPPLFNIIRHYGQKNEAMLPDGTKVYRKDQIYVPEWNGFVPCAQYDDHFIFEVPKKFKVSSFLCSCGSIAVAAGVSGYQLDASPQGKLLICYYHSIYGYHAGGSKWI